MPLIDNGLEILSPEQCHDLLRRNDVGRVGVTVAALPAIFPVNYAVIDGDIIFRTGQGTKLRAAVEQAVVAFQIDHFDKSAGSGWSVMAIGLAEQIIEPGELARAQQLGLHPFARGDRTHFIKIRPEFLSGRRII